jgi:hypothetical protein
MPFASSIEGKVAFGRGGISVIPLAGSLFFNGGGIHISEYHQEQRCLLGPIQ